MLVHLHQVQSSGGAILVFLEICMPVVCRESLELEPQTIEYWYERV